MRSGMGRREGVESGLTRELSGIIDSGIDSWA